MQKTIIIAEIGENHLGNIDLAIKMIKDAANAGVDFVKFQSYRGKDFSKDDPEKEWFARVELSNEAHFILRKEAESNNVQFLSSPFSLERTEFLVDKLKLNKIKIASGMMLNLKVLDYLDSKKIDTVFFSTGMATLSEIHLSLNHLSNIPNIYLLHCVTQYPCKNKEANLRAILTLQKEFNYPIGYSDHTIGTEACIAGVALGAIVIEKHFTFDKNYSEGTDHLLSVEAGELKEMVEKIRRLEVLLGDEIKKPSRSEKEIMKFVRNRFPG